MATEVSVAAARSADRKLPPIAALLLGQAVALGFTLANLIIPGSAIFLSAYGSGRLPYVYLIVAAAGSLVSIAVNRLQDRFGLHQLAISATLAVASVAALSWWLIAGNDQLWAGYIVLTLFAIHLQMGFVFIGAQAGRAFDVQQIKRFFPRIVSGFVFGFMVGGFLADPLQNTLGRADHLLLVSAGGAGVMAALMLLAGRLGSTSESVTDAVGGDAGLATDTASPADATDSARLEAARPESALPESGAPPHAAGADVVEAERAPSLRALFAIPLVSSVFAYQVLSAMGTQLVDFLVYDRAVARYSGTEELTTFMGSFTAILNLTALIVLVLFGSMIMARYGLRFGVGANPLVVTGLVVMALGASALLGIGSTTLFVLVAIARISDITLADMATRTSVNATFQVLPPDQRLAAQVGVEGAGVPLALGLTAVMILAINALFDSPTVPVLVATMAVCVAWCWLSFVVFGRYRAGTVLAARRRMLDDVHVDLAEPATRAALVDLARSDSADGVGAAVDLLAADDPGSVDELLLAATAHQDLAIGHAVLHHLVARHPTAAAEVAVRCVQSSRKRFVVDGIRALGHIDAKAAGPHLSGLVEHDDQDIRTVALAASIAMDAHGDQTGRERLDQLVHAESAEARSLAAGIIGELGATEDVDQLLELAVDPDRQVRAAAATAIGSLPDAAQNTIFNQLVDVGDRRAIGELLRQCAGRAGPETCASVARWLAGADHVLAHRGVRFLVANHHRLASDDAVFAAAVDAQVARAEAAVHWATELAGNDLTGKKDELDRLRRALGAERAQAQRHLIDVLALAYDRDLMARVGHLWSDRIDGDHGMAREALDLTIAEGHRASVLAALADRSIGDAETCSLAGAAALARNTSWAAEPDWLQACAVSLCDQSVDDVVAAGPITGEVLAARR